MPNVEELIVAMVKPLIEHPEDMTVHIQETEDFMEYQLVLHSEDVGRVIGRQGRVANAIRTILYSIKGPGNKRIRLTIDGVNSAE